MLALVEGGSCAGVVYRLEGEDIKQRLAPIWKREMIAYGYEARWVTAHTEAGPDIPALAFVAWTDGPRYAGELDDEEIATSIAEACGHTDPARNTFSKRQPNVLNSALKTNISFALRPWLQRILSGAAE